MRLLRRAYELWRELETVAGEQLSALRAFAECYFPEGAGPTSSLEACLFENTPDEHFLLGLHPNHENVIVAGGDGARVQVRERDRRRSSRSSRGESPPLDIGLLSPRRFAGRSG